MEHLIATVSQQGQVVIPLLDSRNNSFPVLYIGPHYERHTVRFFARMIDRAQAEKLPCTFGSDRRSVSFDPKYLVITGPLPYNANVHFYRLRSQQGDGKINKYNISTWSTRPQTGLHPSLPIKAPLLNPGDWITFEGDSHFFRKRYSRQARGMFEPPPLPNVRAHMPTIRQGIPFSIALVAQLHWLPSKSRDTQVKIVSGNPLLHVPANPAESEPMPEYVPPPPSFPDPGNV